VTERKRIQKELQASEMLFKTISNASPITLWLSDENGAIVYVNETWVEWTGLSLEASLGQGWIEAIIEEDREKAGSQFLANLGARRYYLIEFRIRRKDGQVRWCLAEGRPYYNVEGNFAGYAGSCSDITERKSIEDELEKRVQLRTEELQVSNKKLETSNQELEQYAYVASHDLQEPLRKIRTYSGLLMNETKNSLNAAAVERLEKITSSAERMSNLITDLLSFSRLLKPDQLFAPTDLNEVLQNILTDFELTIQQKNALVKIEQLPVIEAMPLQMNQLFYNLINNALKFSKENETPLIIIKSRLLTYDEMMENKILNPQLSYHKISIGDNGIGFNQQFADQIFEVFKRLHTKQAYPGSGIGLALCKKIALNHQGYIFAEAKEGLGAIFHVLLPAAEF
jgi:two-component system CheB/CheR fusion protein